MSETLKKIEALEAEIKKLKDEVNKPQFEVGKWYKDTSSNMIIHVTEIKNGFKGYGLNTRGEWRDNKDDDGLFYGGNLRQAKKELIQATDKEVEDALIAEAKRRGFNDTVIVKRDGYKWSFSKIKKFEFVNNELRLWGDKSCGNGFYDGYIVIFENGKWDEIVKDEPIKIVGRYEVVFNLGFDHISPNRYVTIDGNVFTKEFWQSAKVISEHSKAKIMVGCSKQFDVSLETINKILDKL